ncbi:hypothetical protein [Streptomyces sp. MP131-18]|uniref:hypothetical protein n=1 Tax=Streptomyces sp. MP131-18 TaxID=1857892 RepID=UPI0009D01EC0|nr:hypothetical protein [Streptomyces sp. MP131-18]ONK13151.1 hypothetical protein STBA_39130 [Streptomyces sp. MP131-18]
MGAIQEPAPAMGPYRVELRKESFYLSRADAVPDLISASSRYELKVPSEDAPALLSALDQVTGHPSWGKWPRPAQDERPDTTWALPPGSDGPAPDPHWTVTPTGPALSIRGPWIVYYETDRAFLSTEICYRDLEELREALVNLSPEESPGTHPKGHPSPSPAERSR